jgi:hypothetical protein
LTSCPTIRKDFKQQTTFFFKLYLKKKGGKFEIQFFWPPPAAADVRL